MTIKYNDKLTAIELRKRGLSYGEIAHKVKVSMSTLSLWLRDFPLSDDHFKAMQRRCLRNAWENASRVNRNKRIINSFNLINDGWKESRLFLRNPLFITGIMLYWAEGTKSQESLIFSNSDPLMIRVMLCWFREFCGIPEERFRLQIHIHSLHRNPEIERYWSEITKIPKKQIIKTQIKKSSLGHRKNILYNGTCSIRVLKPRALFRKMIGWRLGTLEYFGIIKIKSEEERFVYIKRIIKKLINNMRP